MKPLALINTITDAQTLEANIFNRENMGFSAQKLKLTDSMIWSPVHANRKSCIVAVMNVSE